MHAGPERLLDRYVNRHAKEDPDPKAQGPPEVPNVGADRERWWEWRPTPWCPPMRSSRADQLSQRCGWRSALEAAIPLGFCVDQSEACCRAGGDPCAALTGTSCRARGGNTRIVGGDRGPLTVKRHADSDPGRRGRAAGSAGQAAGHSAGPATRARREAAQRQPDGAGPDRC